MFKKGFTLIELLVVIAIIAILAAILFPVFAQAREKARGATCLSNAKQLGTGLQLYVDDYDETLPRSYGWGANPQCHPMSLAAVRDNVTVPNGVGCLMDYVTNGAWNKYATSASEADRLKNLPGLFKCPSDGAMRDPASTWTCSYFYWSPTTDINTGGEGCALAELDNSAGTVIIIERGQEGLWANIANKGHNGMTPAVFADGHAKTYKIQTPVERWGFDINNCPWPVHPDTIWPTK